MMSRSLQWTTIFSTRKLVVLVLAYALASMATPLAFADDKGIAERCSEYMNAAVEVEQFSGAVLVAKGSEILFEHGYGMANAEHQVPNRPETKFRLGSITKQFTAAAILILQDERKLNVRDAINQYVPTAQPAWEPITIHHLLTHTSGIPSYTSDFVYGLSMHKPETVSSMIARFKDKPLEFQPGERFNYSNSGYFLLGAIIEKVSGKRYEDFMREAVFEPLGMKHTGYDRHATILANRASGYERRGDQHVNASYLDMSQPYAAGALYSTVGDLLIWDRALKEGKLLSKESMAAMFTPEKNGYAYGWTVGERRGRKFVGHGGGINGFATEFLRFPDDDLCVVVLSNVVPSNPGKFAHDLARLASGESVDPPKVRQVAKIDPQIYDEYAGQYEIAPKFILTVTREGDHLMTQATGQPKVEAFPESATAFFLKVVDAQLTFVKENGKVTHVVLHQNGSDRKAARIEAGSEKKDEKNTEEGEKN